MTQAAQTTPSAESHNADTPDSRPPAQNKSLAPLRRLLGFLWPHKTRLIAASIALVFTAVAQLGLGYGVKVLIDEGFSSADPSGLYKAVSLMLMIGLALASGGHDPLLFGLLVGRARQC